MKNATIKPPFKWTGGKNRMRDQYRDIFAPPDGNIDTFVDMFCGACSVSLWVAENYPDTKIVLNDFNSELMELYRVFQEEYEPFEKQYLANVNKLLPMEHADRKKFYYEVREKYCHHWEENPTWENAADLFFMMRINFNGMWKAYHKCNGRYSTPPGTLTQKDKFFKVDEIRKFKSFLDKCELRSGDFGELTEWMKPGTYYYADPPYRDSIVEYKDAFSEEDQIRLAEFLKEADSAGCWFSESNKEIGDGFWEIHLGEYKIHDMSAKYTAGRGKTLKNVKEVLITNF